MRITNISSWPNRCPGRRPRGCRRSAKNSEWSLWPRFSSGAPRDLPQYGGHHRRGWHLSREVPEDAHSRRPALSTRSFISRPGDLGFSAWDTKFARIGVCVCWDQWYPEAARLTALRGAQILFYPTAIGWHPQEKADQGARQHSSWETIQRGHAVANGCYVAVPNRVGHEAPDGGPASNFGDKASFAIPRGKSSPKLPTTKRASSSWRPTSRPSRSSARTGRFCATEGLTLTRKSPVVSSTSAGQAAYAHPPASTRSRA